ncbi:aldo/keto reductase [Amylibacter sp.]|nr:aldo/keto reductase [Amylibacter sp.]
MSIYYEKTYQRCFGTFPLKGKVLFDAIQHASNIGYRAYDTAQMYENEMQTGEALEATGIKRSNLCLATKVHPDNFSDQRFIDSVEESLKALRTDYVDVLLLHWPPIGGDIAPSLKLLEKAKNIGLARNIGVSNYTAKMMYDAKEIIETPLVTNQIEFHPLLNQDVLLNASVETGIPLSSYCSLARGEVFKYPIFSKIGEKYDKSPAQVILSWILHKGVSVNTMSTNPKNIEENFNILNFTLNNIDINNIEKMKDTGFRIVGEDLVPWAPEWD